MTAIIALAVPMFDAESMLRRLRGHHRFMIDFSLGMFGALRRPVFLYLSALSSSIMLISGGVFYFLEHPVNPKVATFLDAFYFVVTTVTGVGYGDITPLTPPGKIFSILLMLLGTGIFVAFTAVVSMAVLEAELKLRPSHPRKKPEGTDG